MKKNLENPKAEVKKLNEEELNQITGGANAPECDQDTKCTWDGIID